MISVRRQVQMFIVLAALVAGFVAATSPGPASAAGWRSSATDPKFTIAVIPDTQLEVLKSSDRRFIERTQWLARHRRQLNLRFVSHVGDVVNWGWLDSRQYTIATRAMRVLDWSGIPYAMSVGNHDTRAVDVGGSAYANNPDCVKRFTKAECNGFSLVRHSEEFNKAFPASRMRGLQGTLQKGKVDNSYSTFTAGGKDWLVLNLEMWPRYPVLTWARTVVADHPHHNVIVQTHSYLNPDATITTFDSSYNMISPRYLYDHLIRAYPNIKLVLSGHDGTTASRTDTGDEGNEIVSLLTAIHSTKTNPMRLIEMDTASGKLRTWIYSSHTNETGATSSFPLSFVN
ncbi:MAG: metallophosphoesterase [Nocardioidaceae bacterium]|nr:metallophosphoesterase [Nocardioidaceae bacterium]